MELQLGDGSALGLRRVADPWFPGSEPAVDRAAAIAAAQDFEPDEPGMRYRKITARAATAADPVRIFVELDDEGYECRRVEHFATGGIGTADPTACTAADEPLDYAKRYPGAVTEKITSTDFQVEWIIAEGERIEKSA